jgi:NADPH2:quinone reductase
MQAVSFSEFGGPEVLRMVERPSPEPRAGEVVVDVVAAGISPTDIMMRRGNQAKLMTDLVQPYTAGMDFAGHVTKVGDGVSLKVGEAVIGVVNPRRPDGGTQAAQIRMPADLVAAIDRNVDLVAAASVPMNAVTAMIALDALGLTPGQNLLVTGGTGIMGGFAIQLARKAGLTVLANGGVADRDLLTRLGADTVLPRDEGLEEALRAACPQGLDGVVDGALIGDKISHLVREGGGVVLLRLTQTIDDPRLRILPISVGKAVQEAAERERARSMIEKVARYIEDGTLTPRIASNGVFDFSDAAEAYAMAERGGFRGRVMLRFG